MFGRYYSKLVSYGRLDSAAGTRHGLFDFLRAQRELGLAHLKTILELNPTILT
jgi:hypothetical protein